jgi:hypothetical protein
MVMDPKEMKSLVDDLLDAVRTHQSAAEIAATRKEMRGIYDYGSYCSLVSLLETASDVLGEMIEINQLKGYN